jgi:hypothetical protein
MKTLFSLLLISAATVAQASEPSSPRSTRVVAHIPVQLSLYHDFFPARASDPARGWEGSPGILIDEVRALLIERTDIATGRISARLFVYPLRLDLPLEYAGTKPVFALRLGGYGAEDSFSIRIKSAPLAALVHALVAANSGSADSESLEDGRRILSDCIEKRAEDSFTACKPRTDYFSALEESIDQSSPNDGLDLFFRSGPNWTDQVSIDYFDSRRIVVPGRQWSTLRLEVRLLERP